VGAWGVPHIFEKLSIRATTFLENLLQLGFHKKLWASKVVGVLILGISRLLTWESWEKHYLGVAPIMNHIKYYKVEGGGFP
jgi:hypothetical protein